MSSDVEGAVSGWINDLKTRRNSAAQTLWERDFLRLDGYDRKEIAARLGCADPTVTWKRDSIRQTSLENQS